MKSVSRILLIATSAMALSMTHAYAGDPYYLEIGSDASQTQAEKNWKSLSVKHKALLKDLKYYPKSVYQDGNSVATRIQAGPVATKDQAQKICNKLFAANTPCFVIQDLDKAPPKSVASISESAHAEHSIQIVNRNPEVLPWLAPREQQPREKAPAAEQEQDRQSSSHDDDSESMWSWVPSLGLDSDSKDSADNKNTARPETKPRDTDAEQKAAASSDDDDSDSMWSWLESDKHKSKRQKQGYSQSSVSEETITAESAPMGVESKDLDMPSNTNTDSKASAKNARVVVGEAIAVPLTSGTQSSDIALPSPSASAPKTKNGLPSAALLDDSPVVVSKQVSAMRRMPENNPSAMLSSSQIEEPTDNGAGWLTIASFDDERQATQTWQRVRSAIPEKAAGLRVRVVRPFMDSQKASTSLSVGPFASGDDAMDFCNSGVKMVDSHLDCRFTTRELSNSSGSHSSGYAARKMKNEARADAALASSAGTSAKAYWAQVISADSQMEAVTKWDSLRSAQSDIFAGKRSNIMASDSQYVVRVGPMAENDDAQALCKSLKSRHVGCLVVASAH